ncbi:hypothetical protein GCM10010168_86180 [Actinoplanes ianthinogenes]|uniref:Chromosome partition protein Smc n=2 Tax=Actinoplanes ianthinogenes TaxID=122358 RepID=A0ABN6CK33_9ACTN|nr:hypothetical protein Aiant_60060 [Actinoplanes ianthinogenes]GGR53943.1 hypothetical protein GCM10010168_86180 [Actinoplanes ianthinogenes]
MSGALCRCGDEQEDHRRKTGGCREPGCGCGKFEPVGTFAPEPTLALDVAALLAEVREDVDREAQLAARLAEVERERDEACTELVRVQRELVPAVDERDQAREDLEKLRAALAEAEQERDQLAALVDQKQTRLGEYSDLLTGSRAKVESVERERDMVQAKLDGALLQLAEVTDERNALRDAVPCGWCDGLGVAPAERFGRDADGAPEADEDRPCPEGCAVPGWLQAERNDAADDARRVAELEALLEQAEQYARDLQDNGDVSPVGRVWDEHVRYLCTTCGSRYREHHNHVCGRLEPVRVRITFIKE